MSFTIMRTTTEFYTHFNTNLQTICLQKYNNIVINCIVTYGRFGANIYYNMFQLYWLKRDNCTFP